MIRVNPASISDLVALVFSGAPVTLTSHPGNASLYKQTLWKCGIPEHLWDVTCCVADANNWPMHRLLNGQAELLLTEEQYQKIRDSASPNRRYITAYQITKNGERLGRVHVRASQARFPNVISSCSRLLLTEEQNIREVFGYLAETRAGRVFTRFIDSDGVMRPIAESGIGKEKLVDSFIGLLRELNHLLFSDEPIETVGGACYDGVMVQISTMLVQYWQTGRIDRYDVSGPDMIHYASRREYQEQLSEMLIHLHKWNPKLVPGNIIVRMFPGTVARVGHITGHISEEVMSRKLCILRNENGLAGEFKARLRQQAKDDENLWPMEIQPKKDCYFSQHDLLQERGEFVVDEFWKDIPFESMRDRLVRANALLQLRRSN